jgi:DNA polymerase
MVEGIRYEGINQTTKKWGLVETYGGKLVENIVQATARDILGQVILRAQANGLEIVFHIHDEVIVDAKPGQTLEEVERLFSAPISWCADLPLKGAGYSTPYYLKD